MTVALTTLIKANVLTRHLGLSQHRHLTSYEVRTRFLDYFIKENSHTYIRSSPVAPLHDHTLAFVNAGMNQFKEVFLDNISTPYKRAANSQKCIRVGGKHNDLKDVGLDTYHHTFFEMLGNWSFGDYFKQEACKLAWTLLTTPPYSIDPKRLYVTYFSGCSELGLPPDLETKEIWLSLDVDSNHILPFGVKENFWEMGSTGPCGGCTEIHVDLLNRGREAANRVNRGFSDVTELWNIVFIQYNRNEDGSLSPLACHHVDTGMGFERLVALLQNKTSNYDTDLFMPLFDTISMVSRAPRYGSVDSLDRAYRVLADHCRMVAVAISDNIFPDSNHKLRRVLRRALLVAEDSFKMEMAAQLVKEVCSRTSDTLSSTYPELGINMDKVRLLVDHEWEGLCALRSDTMAAWQQLVAQDPRLTQLATSEVPGLCAAYRELVASKGPPGYTISADQTWRLYDTHGLPLDTIDELCQALGLTFREDEFNTKLAEAKAKSLQPGQLLRTEAVSKKCLEEFKQTIPVTDDSAKYNYTRNEDNGKVTYTFPEVQCTVLAVVWNVEMSGGEGVGEGVGVVLDRTCLYHEAGGQAYDRGVVEGEGWRLQCDSVVNCAGYIVHLGTLTSSSGKVPCVGANARVRLDETRRLALMRHHTTTHLLHSALTCLFPATHQRGSHISQQQLTFDFATYGQAVTDLHVKEVERRVQEVIAEGVPVTRITVAGTELASMDDVTLLPGETYPAHGIHLVNIQANELTSKEACCGTHVLNTRDLEGVCVLGVSSPGGRARSMTVVAGPAADQARQRANIFSQRVAALCQRVDQATDCKVAGLERELKSLRKEITDAVIPHVSRTEAFSRLDSAATLLKETARGNLKMSMEEEMRDVLQSVGQRRFLVHGLRSTMGLDASLQLQKVTRLCPAGLPVIIVGYAAGQLKARCVVPQEKVSTAGVSAQAWLEPVLAVVGGQGGAPRGQDPCLVYNMKPLRVPPTDAEKLIQQALQVANRVANKLFDD